MIEQVVLSPLRLDREGAGSLSDLKNSLLIPVYMSVVSCTWLAFNLFKKTGLSSQISKVASQHLRTRQTFILVRLLASGLLCALSVASTKAGIRNNPGFNFSTLSCLSIPIASAYATILLILVLSSSPKLITLPASEHSITLCLAVFAVYLFRDLWPLATYELRPKDLHEGWLLWAKVICAFVSGVFIPLFTPRIPVISDDVEDEESTGESTASWASLLTYSFLDPFMLRANRVPTQEPEDFPAVPMGQRTLSATRSAFPYLNRWCGASDRFIGWSLLSFFKLEYCRLALLLSIKVLSNFAAPLAINRLLRYLEGEASHLGNVTIRPWIWIALLFFGPLAGTIAFQAYAYYATTRIVVGVEAILTQLLFDHALRVRMKVDQDKNGKNTHFSGRLNNLVTSDISNIVEAREFLNLILYSPLEFGLAMWFLYSFLGWSAFVGFGLMVICLPVPSYLAKKVSAAQRESSKKTDARVQAITETLNIVTLIKLLGWRSKMSERIATLRNEELRVLLRRKFIGLVWNNVNSIVSLVQMIACFATFTIVNKRPLDASIVFSTIPVFTLIRRSLIGQIDMINTMIAGKISLDRFDTFLKESELLDEYAEPCNVTNGDIQDSSVSLHDAVFTWSASSDPGSFQLHVQSILAFQKGKLNIIVGPTGSGKTSLLMALLGEMHQKRSVDGTTFEPVSKLHNVAYAAQESWVQNATIKANILFETPYEPDRYHKVLFQCGLTRDLKLFEAGDMTEVGEKGVTLSGGQKARITLARTVYSHASVLLLDDVLAALDAQTAKHIVDHCLLGDLLQGRTVILVTHNLALTSDVADFVVEIKDGRIAQQGSAADVLARDPTLRPRSEKQSQHDAPDVDTANSHIGEVAPKRVATVLIKKEEISQGRVSRATMFSYFASMGGNWTAIFWLAMLVGSFLGYWAEQYTDTPANEVDARKYILAYCGLVLISTFIYCTRSIIFTYGQLRASRQLHLRLINAILGTTLRWLNTTPTSRIIARCTRDIRAVDVQIPGQLLTVIEQSMVLIARLISVVVVTPILVLPGITVVLAGQTFAHVYLKAQLSVKRHSSVAQAPVLAHFGDAIAGIVSIRAYGAEASVRAELMARSDRCMRTNRLLYNLNRWINVRMDILASLFPTIVAAYLVYGPGKGSIANTGFSINQAVAFSSMILWWVRNINSLEVAGNSLERLEEYSKIEEEPQAQVVRPPPAYWPASGELRVENLSARYSTDGPNILRNLSFHVKSGERLGIVGRTGSGKSSLTLSLLRCIYTEGSVLYDGVSTSSMDLDTLRGAMAIIPQMPELLSGTLRENLDPFSEHPDSTLNAALQSTGLIGHSPTQEVAEHHEVRTALHLDSHIASGGSNLSVGQRQLIALARAMIRQTKLLILDEATSAIDNETDALIQTSLREQLPKDTTVLIVAHRLRTVLDADKIMVLDSGRIVEFGSPRELLTQEKGHLWSLVDASGEADLLRTMARNITRDG